MKKLKVGIIGLEFGATCHLPVFKKNNKCEVIALCSNNLKKAKSLAKKNDIGMVFQHFNLFETLSVFENLIIDSDETKENLREKIKYSKRNRF